MKVNRSLFLIICMFCFYTTQAQFGREDSKSKKFIQLKGTTTVVVLDNDSTDFNSKMVYAITNYWKFTKYIFIKVQDIDAYLSNPDYSFIYRYRSIPAPNSVSVSSTSLLLGINNKKSISALNELYTMASIRLGDDYNFCLINLLQAMHICLLYTETTENASGSEYEMCEYYNSKSATIRTKTLLIDHQLLEEEFCTIDKIEQLYDYNVKITAKEYIEKAILEQDEEVVYFYTLYFQYFKNIFIISAKSGEILYADTKITDYTRGQSVREKDFKKIAKEINRSK